MGNVYPKIIQLQELKEKFRVIATCFLFLTTSAKLESVSISILESLASSLNLSFTRQNVVEISLIAPRILEFSVDDGVLGLKLPFRKTKNVAKRMENVDKLCREFDALAEEYCSKPESEQHLQSLEKQMTKRLKPEIDYFLNQDWDEFTASLCSLDYFIDRLVDYWQVSESCAKFQTINTILDSRIIDACKEIKIDKFYSHQAEAIDFILEGKSIVLPTTTSSGKSLVYMTTIAQKLIQDEDSCFLLIFPTKALAQDQKSRILEFLSIMGLLDVGVETFDGDTPKERREYIRNNCKVLLTNPDMLHVSILPHHYLWTRYLKNTRLVVVDEIHYYYGRFGSAFSMVLMRFCRVCEYYGNDKLQFIGCSATIHDPLNHFQELIGFHRDCHLVSCDGSPSAEKLFVVYKANDGDSFVMQIVRVLVYLLAQGVKTIVFAKTRSMCEVLYKELKSYCTTLGSNLFEKVMSYRGGYSVSERRVVERKLFDGQLLAVISTNALEVGVDIGSLDAVVNAGYPRTSASFYQQAGRAGRRGKKSLNILFLDPGNWTDQIYIKQKELLRKRTLQKLCMEAEDESIIDVQLNCAAQELPIRADDEFFFGQDSKYSQACLEYLRHDPVPNVNIY